MTNFDLIVGEFLDELNKIPSIPAKIAKIDEKLQKLREDEDQDQSSEKNRVMALLRSFRQLLVKTLSSSSIPPPSTSSLHPPSPSSLATEIDFFKPPSSSTPSTVPSCSQLATVTSLDSFSIPQCLSSSSVPLPSTSPDLSLRLGPPSSDLLPGLDPPPSSSQPWLLPNPPASSSVPPRPLLPWRRFFTSATDAAGFLSLGPPTASSAPQGSPQPTTKRRIWTPQLKGSFDRAVEQLGGLYNYGISPNDIKNLISAVDITEKQILSKLVNERKKHRRDDGGESSSAKRQR